MANVDFGQRAGGNSDVYTLVVDVDITASESVFVYNADAPGDFEVIGYEFINKNVIGPTAGDLELNNGTLGSGEIATVVTQALAVSVAVKATILLVANRTIKKGGTLEIQGDTAITGGTAQIKGTAIIIIRAA